MPRQDPVERARQLAAVIAEHGSEASCARRLPQPIADAIADARLGHVSVPTELGGEACDGATYYRVIETISYSDGSAGWCVNVWAEHADIVASYFPKDAVREVLSSPQVLVCGSNLLKPMEAEKVAGGIRLSGRFFTASGIHNSQWATWGTFLHQDGTPLVPDPDGKARLTTGIVPVADVEILDTWHTMGMQGTGTHDFVLHEVTIPEHLIVSDYSTPLREGLSVKLSFFAFLALTKCAVLTGIARSILDLLTETSRTKKPLFASMPLGDDPITQREIGAAEAKLRAARSFMFEAIQRAEDRWERTGSLDVRAKTLLHLAIVNAAQASVEIGLMAQKTIGTSTAFDRSPFKQKVCDLMVGGSHPNLRDARYAELARHFIHDIDPFANMPL